MDAFILPQAAGHLLIVPSWFCSWREVDLQSLKGNPDEESEEVTARSFLFRGWAHLWVHTSRRLKACGCPVQARGSAVWTRRASYGVGLAL